MTTLPDCDDITRFDGTGMTRAKVGTQIFWLIRKLQIRKFLGSIRNSNPQISLVSQYANPQICMVQIRIGLLLIIFFSYVSTYILDNEMPCNYASNLLQSQRLSSNLTESIYSLYLSG